MSVKEYNVRKKYKLEPPDGGWGYMIIVGVIINLSTMTMFQGSSGLVYNGLMADVNIVSTDATTLGIAAMFTAISGFLTNPLLSYLSVRMLTLIAASIFDIGVILCAFINASSPLYIFIGILQGTGLGIMYNLSFTVLNEYFVKKRLMAVSLTQTVITLIAMVTPTFLKWSLEEYGHRGTLILISGITLNNLIGVALLQPVEQHMKRIETQDNDIDVFIQEKESEEKPRVMTKLELTEVKANVCTTKEQTQELLSTENGDDSRLNKIIDVLFDKSLQKTFLLSCVSLGPALCIFAEVTYTNMLPQALYEAKWDQYYVNLALSLMSFGDLTSRALFTVCSKLIMKLTSEEVYVLGVIVALVARLGSLWSKNLIVNLIFITLTGAAHCSIIILIPVIIADAVPPQKFTAAMGIFILMTGVVNLILGLAIGAVRTLTTGYGAVLYLIASCFAMVSLFWLIELCYKKSKHKRLQRREYLRQKKLNKG